LQSGFLVLSNSIFFFNKFLTLEFFFIFTVLKSSFFNGYKFYNPIFFSTLVFFFQKNKNHLIVKKLVLSFYFLNTKSDFFFKNKFLYLKIREFSLSNQNFFKSLPFLKIDQRFFKNNVMFLMSKLALFKKNTKGLLKLKSKSGKLTVFDIFKKKKIIMHNGMYFSKREKFSIINVCCSISFFKRCKYLKSHPHKNVKF
jgi:hypothetical protein